MFAASHRRSAGRSAASPSDDQRRGQSQQQEAECGALFPIEASDELSVDLLGEPLRVLAAEQRRGQVIAEVSMNTTMQPAVMPGAACGITMLRRIDSPPAPRS